MSNSSFERANSEVEEYSENDDPSKMLDKIQRLINLLGAKRIIYCRDIGQKDTKPPTKVTKVQVVVQILNMIDKYVRINCESLGLDLPYDPKKFENDLKFFREWFRAREDSQRRKFEFFYGAPVAKQANDNVASTNKPRRGAR